MSIELRVVYKDVNREEFYSPIISTGPFSGYAEYWEPIITQLNWEWVQLVKTAGLPLLLVQDKLDEIREEFQQLHRGISLSDNIPDEVKDVTLKRIELIMTVIDDIRADPDRFSHVSLG